MISPIVTFTSDFGTADHYVAAMKAAVLKHCGDVRLIDVTHEIGRHDIVAGSFTLEPAIASFPPGTVHLAVVDPGVGTDRGLLIAEIDGSRVVCPDNGLITWAWRCGVAKRATTIDWRPATLSSTFHGRDVMAPVAGQLAGGVEPSTFGRVCDRPVLLDLHPATVGHAGVVIHIDHFGNATTNIPAELVPRTSGAWQVNGNTVGTLRRTYGDVNVGEPLVLIGSSELLEIAVRDGSAAQRLGLRVGNTVEFVTSSNVAAAKD